MDEVTQYALMHYYNGYEDVVTLAGDAADNRRQQIKEYYQMQEAHEVTGFPVREQIKILAGMRGEQKKLDLVAHLTAMEADKVVQIALVDAVMADDTTDEAGKIAAINLILAPAPLYQE